MNTTPVYVVGDENGSVITVSSNNPEYGWVTLRQDVLSITNGWANKKSLSTIIMGEVGVLEAMDLAAGEVLDGKIVVIEQLKPFTTPDRDVKVAGSSKIVCKVNGQPIYRKTFYTVDPKINSVFIQHDNVDEIRGALALEKAKGSKVVSSTASVEELADAFDL